MSPIYSWEKTVRGKFYKNRDFFVYFGVFSVTASTLFFIFDNVLMAFIFLVSVMVIFASSQFESKVCKVDFYDDHLSLNGLIIPYAAIYGYGIIRDGDHTDVVIYEDVGDALTAHRIHAPDELTDEDITHIFTEELGVDRYEVSKGLFYRLWKDLGF